jgi:hypothetical protein
MNATTDGSIEGGWEGCHGQREVPVTCHVGVHLSEAAA